MKRTIFIIMTISLALNAAGQIVRTETILKEWDFRRGHDVEAAEGWEKVAVPHDWAIYCPRAERLRAWRHPRGSHR